MKGKKEARKRRERMTENKILGDKASRIWERNLKPELTSASEMLIAKLPSYFSNIQREVKFLHI
jgi:hypothetical protein